MAVAIRGGGGDKQQQQQQITTACEGRKETIPVLARAKNLKGKWKYLVQKSGNRVQHHEVGVQQQQQQQIYLRASI